MNEPQDLDPRRVAPRPVCAPRRPTRQINVGGVPMGGGAPVRVQSMTTTRTGDVQATLEQIRELASAGAFYFAEEYHQQYLHQNPHGYCNHGFCQAAYPVGASSMAGD